MAILQELLQQRGMQGRILSRSVIKGEIDYRLEGVSMMVHKALEVRREGIGTIVQYIDHNHFCRIFWPLF